MTRRVAGLAAMALAAAVVPLPPAVVERWYSRGFYLLLQRALTPVASAVPIALLDAAILAAVGCAIFFLRKRWRSHGRAAALRGAALTVVAAAAALYLVFLLLWGLNYRRVTLEAKLAYDQSRVTREATRQLAEAATGELNRFARPSGGLQRAPEALEASFARVQQHLGAPRPAVPAPPKRSIFSWYLRSAGIDGMMNPFFLEIILNPEVLPMERPFSLAHEWAHLGGYADESEANFVAWLTCVGADPVSQYSAWLEAFRYAAATLPRPERNALYERLAPDVLADLRAINERLGRADPVVSGFARNVYDSYLRSQGVNEGIGSYGAVLRLMVGTTFENGWVPQRRD